MNLSTQLVSDIITELEKRKGFNYWWDDIEDHIKCEIITALDKKIADTIMKNYIKENE